MLISTRFSSGLNPNEKPTKVDLNSAVFPGGPPSPTKAPKMTNFVDTKEIVRGPQDTPGYWVVTGAKLCVEGGRISIKAKYSLLTVISEESLMLMTGAEHPLNAHNWTLILKRQITDNYLKPGTKGHTLVAKVLSSNMVLQKGRAASRNLRQTRISECLVGDETGTVLFTARNEQVDLMKPDDTVILRNAKIDMFKGSMRLAVDKWGRIEVTDPAKFVVKEDNNLSLVEYELVSVLENDEIAET
ncbi:hypothetical protein GOBAR_AA07149 [Gossypium barbadense]|uniref:Single-stranded DNA binding protein Ssb-like OB fold domain-containing protein n=1 Tax=Gossypium barbadense TaxID=3634 RepID=A0A2P5YCZ2_GOSBA|nr:hypothetical protein GOBAR_AA07149 [Gossypium barbadense]